MRIKNWSFPYALGYAIVTAGLNTFYKRHEVVGVENIPKDKPIVFASNHQNAFLDPVLIAVQLTKPTYYLVRADIFKKPTVAKIFASINMMPVFRERDGVDTKKANIEVFEKCYSILSKNRPIIIFPEGNHGKYKNLRGLKKGFARIAAGAENHYGSDIDVQIVPVGVNYSEHRNMGADLYIEFGKPIDVSDHIQSLDNAREINDTKNLLAEKMSELLIDIDMKNYHLVHETMTMFEPNILEDYTKDNGSLQSKFKGQKSFIAKAENYISDQSDVISEKEAENFKDQVEKMNLRYWLFEKEKHSVLGQVLALFILFPIHLYGMINNYLPYRIPAWFVENKIKDLQFHSSLKMAMGVILFFVFWLLQGSIVALFLSDFWDWFYWVSLPVSAWISYQYWIFYLKTKGQMTYNKLMKNPTQEFKELQNIYDRFKKFYKEVTQSS